MIFVPLRFISCVVALLTFAVARSAEPAPELPTELPPFLVEDDANTRIDWLYCEHSGIRVLSACTEEQTRGFTTDLLRNRAALHRFIPESYLFRSEVPHTIILFPRSHLRNLDEEMAKAVRAPEKSPSEQSRWKPIDDLTLGDRDSLFTWIIVNDHEWVQSSLTGQGRLQVIYSRDYLKRLLLAHAPPWPDWFVSGISRLYSASLFPELKPPGQVLRRRTVDSKDCIESFEAQAWTSYPATRALREDAATPRALLPLEELLITNAPPETNAAYRQTWEAETELFVRWAYANGRERLWRLAETAARQPLSGAVFRENFGLDYADARDALSDWLHTSVDDALFLPAITLDSPDELLVRSASSVEIQQIKGEWNRRCLDTVVAKFPVLKSLYSQKASNLLDGPYRRGERDAQLIASLILLEMDQEHTPRARELLEKHPEAKAARPRVALLEAQFQFEDMIKRSGESSAADQQTRTSELVAQLALIAEREPPMEATYVLAVRALMRLSAEPSAIQRAFIAKGAQLFPRTPLLVAASTAWDLRAGETRRAQATMELAFRYPMEERFRNKLETLRDLAVAASSDVSKQKETANPR